MSCSGVECVLVLVCTRGCVCECVHDVQLSLVVLRHRFARLLRYALLEPGSRSSIPVLSFAKMPLKEISVAELKKHKSKNDCWYGA